MAASSDAADLTIIARDWTPKPHWIETDQIATIDVQLEPRRRLAALASETQTSAVSDSIRMMLGLSSDASV